MSLLNFYLYSITALSLGALFLHALPKLGKTGEQIADFFCQAPGIDLALAYFTLVPLILGAVLRGWLGVGIALLAELTTVWFWIIAHELAHYSSWQDPKIHRTISRLVGTWRNHLAIWITALAIPIFWAVRFAEIFIYFPLPRLVGFPKYEAKEWVNVSRQKFLGLIGYDLIWCLYCDWMTGVWSLGTEMLRNVESFWCPIRFYSDKKCANCQVDFPDLTQGWVGSDKNMEDVVKLLEEKYAPPRDENSWFGHPSRAKTKASDSET